MIFMVDISIETAHTIQGLAIEGNRSKVDKHTSLKRKRESEADILLRAQGIKHGEKCKRCSLNCDVKHRESVTFWAVLEGTPPKYTLDTCPRQGHLEKLKVKTKKHKTR